MFLPLSQATSFFILLSLLDLLKRGHESAAGQAQTYHTNTFVTETQTVNITII